LEFIAKIEDVLGIVFDGETQAEAHVWISEHLDEYSYYDEMF